MTRFDPWRYLAIETAIGVAINTLVATAPLLLFLGAGSLSGQTVRDVAVSLTPQFLMGAFMSALVPSLLTRWRQEKGRFGIDLCGVGPTFVRIAVVASVLAASFTTLVLASIHLMTALGGGRKMEPQAVLLLCGAEGALAAAVITPLALVHLFGRDWVWTSPR